jgi:hypothetical protein
MGVVLEGQLVERRTLHVHDADSVERDIDAPRLCRHRIGVSFNGRFIERVHFRCLGHTSAAEISRGTSSSRGRVRLFMLLGIRFSLRRTA